MTQDYLIFSLTYSGHNLIRSCFSNCKKKKVMILRLLEHRDVTELQNKFKQDSLWINSLEQSCSIRNVRDVYGYTC